jgi:hypothetical protein
MGGPFSPGNPFVDLVQQSQAQEKNPEAPVTTTEVRVLVSDRTLVFSGKYEPEKDTLRDVNGVTWISFNPVENQGEPDVPGMLDVQIGGDVMIYASYSGNDPAMKNYPKKVIENIARSLFADKLEYKEDEDCLIVRKDPAQLKLLDGNGKETTTTIYPYDYLVQFSSFPSSVFAQVKFKSNIEYWKTLGKEYLDLPEEKIPEPVPPPAVPGRIPSLFDPKIEPVIPFYAPEDLYRPDSQRNLYIGFQDKDPNYTQDQFITEFTNAMKAKYTELGLEAQIIQE